jgi:hypothetical protein
MKLNLWKELLPIQRDLLNSEKMIAGIVSSRATGKTFILSWMITLALMKGEKVLIFSQTYSTLKQNLFAEVMNRFYYLQDTFPEIADRLMPQYNRADMTISYNNGICFGYSYDNYENVRGQSDIALMVLDEVAMAPGNLLDVAAACLRGKNLKPKIRFCTTPRVGSVWNRRFREHASLGDWDIFTGTYKDNVHLSPESIALIESSVSDPIMRQQELEGAILDTVVENCILNGVRMAPSRGGKDTKYVMGVDVARFGNDSTVIVVRDSYGVVEKVPMFHADTYAVASKIEELMRKYGISKLFIDGTGGFSSGIEDYLRLNSVNIVSVNFGGKASDPHNLNVRADMYSNLVKAVDDGFYVDDPELLDELNATSYIILNTGKKAIVPKEKIKEILGHSPDALDALALTFMPDTTIDRSTEAEYMNMFFR